MVTHVDGVLVVGGGIVAEHPVREAGLGPPAGVRHVRVVVHLNPRSSDFGLTGEKARIESTPFTRRSPPSWVG